MIFDVTIAKTADTDVFWAQCENITKKGANVGIHIAGFDALVDVDGSLINTYTTTQNETIKVCLDIEVDVVYVISTIPIDELLVK